MQPPVGEWLAQPRRRRHPGVPRLPHTRCLRGKSGAPGPVGAVGRTPSASARALPGAKLVRSKRVDSRVSAQVAQLPARLWATGALWDRERGSEVVVEEHREGIKREWNCSPDSLSNFGHLQSSRPGGDFAGGRQFMPGQPYIALRFSNQQPSTKKPPQESRGAKGNTCHRARGQRQGNSCGGEG